MSRSDPSYHPLDVRAETLTAAQVAAIEEDASDNILPEMYFAHNLTAALWSRDTLATTFATRIGMCERRMRRLTAGETMPHYHEIPALARALNVDAAKLAWSPPAAFRLSLRRAA